MGCFGRYRLIPRSEMKISSDIDIWDNIQAHEIAKVRSEYLGCRAKYAEVGSNLK